MGKPADSDSEAPSAPVWTPESLELPLELPVDDHWRRRPPLTVNLDDDERPQSRVVIIDLA